MNKKEPLVWYSDWPLLSQITHIKDLIEAATPHAKRLFTKDDMRSFTASLSASFPAYRLALGEVGDSHCFRLFVLHEGVLMDFWPVYGNYNL